MPITADNLLVNENDDDDEVSKCIAKPKVDDCVFTGVTRMTQ